MTSAAEPSDAAGRHRSDPGPSETVPPEDLPPADAGPPEDLPAAEEALAQEIPATREQLGETVEALAAKADVKARLRGRARAVSGKARARAGGAAQSARSAAAPRAGLVKDRASAADKTVKQAMPGPVQRAVSRTTGAASQRRRPLTAAGAAVGLLVVCWLVVRRRRHDQAVAQPTGPSGHVLGGVLAGAIFKRLWKLTARQDEAPKATDADHGWRQILTAAAAQGAGFRARQSRGRPQRRGHPEADRHLARRPKHRQREGVGWMTDRDTAAQSQAKA